jgi:hypothetical protein
MAINFLTSVDFNENEILGAAIQNLGTDPASGVLGQIYFNTSEDALKVCTVASTTNATWVAVGGGVETITKATGTNPITLSGTTDVLIGITQSSSTVNGFLSSTDWSTFNSKTSNLGTVTSVELAIDNATALDIAGTNPVTSSGTIDLEWQGDSAQVVLGDGTLGDYEEGTVTSVGLSIDNSAALAVNSGSTPITGSGTLDLEWQGLSSEYVTADGGKVSIPSSDNYNYWTLSDGTTTTNISSQGTAIFSGTNNEVDVFNNPSGTITIGLPQDVTISRDLTVTKTATVDSLAITNKGTSAATAGSDSATTLATKGYVDSLTSGQLVYAGGYDASTDPPTGAAVLQGYTYVVTVAGSGSGGTYWSTPLAIGDLIIALQDNPTAEANWTEVNKNVTEATLTTIGEGNVNAGTATTVSYSSGTATVGVDYTATTGLVAAAPSGSGTPDQDDQVLIGLDSSSSGETVSYALVDLPFVTSVGLDIDNSDALAVSNSPVTGAGTIDLEWQGSSSEYINGAGDLVNFPTIPQGDITKVDVTSPINGGGSSGDVTIGIDNATAAAVGAARVAAGTGIGVSVSNGVFTVTNNDPGSTASNGKRYSLGATSGAVVANGLVGGETSWTINTATDLGKNDAKDVQCEVISSAGETVYAQITRSTKFLTISFNGSVTNGSYEAVLISI